jgi:hypothetical protein
MSATAFCISSEMGNTSNFNLSMKNCLSVFFGFWSQVLCLSSGSPGTWDAAILCLPMHKTGTGEQNPVSCIRLTIKAVSGSIEKLSAGKPTTGTRI